MIYCAACGIVPVPEEDLPVLLPENVEITLAGGSPLGNVPEFVNVACPKCGAPARRETDTMDTFVDSSWYFYRYTDPTLSDKALDSDTVGYWFPDRPVHRRSGARHPAPDLFALLDQGDARHGIGDELRAGGAAVHPGHGDQGRRQDVEEPGQRGLARRHGGALRRRFHAHVHAVCGAAGPRSGLAGRGRRRRQPIPVAGVPVCRAQCQARRSGVEGQSRRTAFARSPQGAAQVAPDHPAGDGRLRRPLALQHVDRGDHGADERAVRLRRQPEAREFSRRRQRRLEWGTAPLRWRCWPMRNAGWC